MSVPLTRMPKPGPNLNSHPGSIYRQPEGAISMLPLMMWGLLMVMRARRSLMIPPPGYVATKGFRQCWAMWSRYHTIPSEITGRLPSLGGGVTILFNCPSDVLTVRTNTQNKNKMLPVPVI